MTLPREHWSSVLNRESSDSFRNLLAAHDALSQSVDSGMQYMAAWALLYASQKTGHPDAPVAFHEAARSFERIASEPVTKLYGWTDDDIPARAALALALAPQVRAPKRQYGIEERAGIYRGLGLVLERTLGQAESGDDQAQGVLGEVVVSALLWRPTPAVLSVLNAVPAGPRKDSRNEGMRQFSTDIYAYHPTLPSTPKGRVNVQVKTTARSWTRKRYDQNAIVVVGLNEAVQSPTKDPMTGREAASWLGHTLLSDMRGERLEDRDEEALMCTGAEIHNRVTALAEAKRERALEKNRRRKR